MAVPARRDRPVTLTGYRYEGVRPTPAGADDFWRMGYGARLRSVGAVLERSRAADRMGLDLRRHARSPAARRAAASTQLRYQFNRKLFVLGRYEGTNDPTNGFTRDGVVLLGYGPSENTRLTIEDVISHVPQTTHTMNIQFIDRLLMRAGVFRLAALVLCGSRSRRRGTRARRPTERARASTRSSRRRSSASSTSSSSASPARCRW